MKARDAHESQRQTDTGRRGQHPSPFSSHVLITQNMGVTRRKLSLQFSPHSCQGCMSLHALQSKQMCNLKAQPLEAIVPLRLPSLDQCGKVSQDHHRPRMPTGAVTQARKAATFGGMQQI